MTSPLILDGHKLGWHLDRVRALINGELVAPITIDMALSRKCNFKCIYCYGQLQSNHEEILSRDILFNFLVP